MSRKYESGPPLGLRRAVQRAAVLGGLALLGFSVSACEQLTQGQTPTLFETGERLFLAGDGSLPAPFNTNAELSGTQAGYKCRVYGFLRAYSSITHCRAVAFRDDTFYDDPPLSAAISQAHPERTLVVGFWAQYGLLLMGLVLLVAASPFIWRGVRRRGAGKLAKKPAKPAKKRQ